MMTFITYQLREHFSIKMRQPSQHMGITQISFDLTVLFSVIPLVFQTDNLWMVALASPVIQGRPRPFPIAKVPKNPPTIGS